LIAERAEVKMRTDFAHVLNIWHRYNKRKVEIKKKAVGIGVFLIGRDEVREVKGKGGEIRNAKFWIVDRII
jgi:hypothetical protein